MHIPQKRKALATWQQLSCELSTSSVNVSLSVHTAQRIPRNVTDACGRRVLTPSERKLVVLHSVLCIAMLLLCGDAHGIDRDRRLDQLQHTRWTKADGVPGAVRALAQTTDGYLWLATTNGLVRYDGSQFEVWEPITGPGLISPNVRALLATPDGGLWIGYVAPGVSFLKNGTLTNYGAKDGLPDSQVYSFAIDKQGRTWLSALWSGLYRLDGSHWDKSVTDFTGLAAPLLVDRRGTLWVGTATDVQYLPTGENKFHLANGAPPGAHGLAEAPDGRVWIADSEHSVKPLPVTGKFDRAADPEIKVPSQSILFDRRGSLWITTYGLGIRRVPFPESLRGMHISETSDAAETFTHKEGLSSDYVICVLEDREGNIWVGTNAGLDRFRQSAVIPINFQSGINVTSMQSAADGSIEVGQDTSKMMVIRDGKIAGSANGVVSIEGYPISDGLVILTSYLANPSDSLKRLANRKIVRGSQAHQQIIYNGSIEDSPNIYSIGISRLDEPAKAVDLVVATRDSLGRPWVSIHSKGVFRFDDHGSTTLERLGGPAGHAVCEYPEPSGTVWFGLANMVAKVDGDKVRTFTAADGVAVGGVFSVQRAKDDLWIGGVKGVELFDGTRFHMMLPSVDGAFDGITGMLAPLGKGLWFQATRGIVNVPEAELVSYKHDPQYRVRFRVFDAQDGLSSVPSTGVAPIEGHDGKLWFATNEGVVWIDPDRIPNNTLSPPMVISSLIAGPHIYNGYSPVTLPAKTTSIQMHYASLSLTIPERDGFRYKLVGSDSGWQDVGNRRDAYYTNLGPGSYTFQVVGSNNDGVWNNVGATLAITILPTYYQTWWFKIFYIAVAAFLFWLFYLYRLNAATAKIQERLGARMEERERIARELHDTLLQGFQGLMLRFQAVLNMLPAGAPAHEMVEKALDRADEVLIEGRQRVQDLRAEGMTGHDLPDHLAKCGEELAQDHAISFTLSVIGAPQGLDPVVSTEAYRIGREALANAFTHSNGSKIEAELTYEPAQLSLRIRDDGDGMDQETLASGRSGHWGIPGMRERAQKIGARVDLFSRPTSGTEVQLTIPARLAYAKGKKLALWRRIIAFGSKRGRGA